MDIKGMTAIRKRLGMGKGGGLARAAYPVMVLTLVLSDVVGDPLDLIASGPIVLYLSTAKEVRQFLVW